MVESAEFVTQVPSQPCPQGGGLNPADLLRLNSGRWLPQVFSPLVGKMAGRPEGNFIHV